MAAKKPARKKKTEGEGCDEQDEKTAAEKFVRDVLTRGEAARPDEHGGLPPGATHEIVDEREGGPPKVKRKRYSMT